MKPQTLALVKHLNAGGSVTRESAWPEFKIQNLTARLSELTALGFEIVKQTRKAVIDSRKVRITTWKLRECFDKGMHVQVAKETASIVLMKGRIGVIERIDLERAQATVYFDCVGYRSLKFNALRRLPHFNPGTRVQIKPAPYVVLEYHPAIKSYTLTSPNPEHTIVAAANLVEVCHAART